MTGAPVALDRRSFAGGAIIAALLGVSPAWAKPSQGPNGSFGMIGKMKAQPGKRAELIAILGAGTGAMPGCLAYLIAEDVKDPDGIWITEIWDSKESHDGSLALPEVRAAIAKGRPLIAGFELSAETRPLAEASFLKR